MKLWGVASILVALGLLAWMPSPPLSAGGEKGRTLIFEMYKDAKGEFRWRLKATNGAVIGTSGQGYKNKADCQHAVDLIKEGAAKARVVEEEPTKK